MEREFALVTMSRNSLRELDSATDSLCLVPIHARRFVVLGKFVVVLGGRKNTKAVDVVGRVGSPRSGQINPIDPYSAARCAKGMVDA